MPCFRGIEVSLATNPQDEEIPEFPHPEGLSAQLLGIHDSLVASSSLSHLPSRRSSSESELGSAKIQKPTPTASVYIPSIPGAPFAIKYSITSPMSCKFIFFKLYVNGRPIAAWGIDPVIIPRGKVVKSLWAPCSRYNQQVGFEGRNLVFLPGQEKKSVAEDGGLIEVRAFRAKERKARVPRLDEFRNQTNYGIATPSIGMLDRPQDACFYDWHLIDAKDMPFALFRFHYRSWSNLELLNLIPPTELRLLRQSALGRLPETTATKPGNVTYEGLQSRSDDISTSSSSSSSSLGMASSDEAVFHGSKLQDNAAFMRRLDHMSSNYFLKSPPELLPATVPKMNVPQPSKAFRDGFRESYLQRPLPELPTDDPSTKPRRGSVASAAPSLTPSLIQYVDDGSFDYDEVEVGVAQVIQRPKTESTSSLEDILKFQGSVEYSISEYETSPPSTVGSCHEKMLSPRHYLPTTGSSLEQDLQVFTPQRKGSTVMKRVKPQSDLLLTSFSEQDLSRVSRLKLSESEWMSRTPSPVRKEEREPVSVRRLWSPIPVKAAGKALLSGLRRRKNSDSPRKVPAKDIFRDEVPKPHLGTVVLNGNDVGNWI
ncbi:hypothetical protein B0T17DRAFT_33342 [Bombardia bombarda]|uniref:Uncharacterized protein n=1 Tax=Bombardia bombarda TaxID=252184 RepID=A0AA40CEC9_9PEZI|nr:hypothetical protein B0T17DRAFT_33342 [Bombardia bombarda]